MRLLLTGATGFLGAHLVSRLRVGEHAVRAFARPTSRTGELESEGVEVARGRFDDPPSLARAVEGCDVVIHAAGGGIVKRASEMYRTNTDSTAALAEAAAAAGVGRFVLVSSLAAHGGSAAGRPATEDDPDAPRSHYGRSKLAAERALARFADRMAITALRPPALYGPGEHRMVELFRAAERGVVPMVHPSGSLSMLHGADCAEAIVRAAESPVGLGTLYVAEATPIRRRAMAEQVGAAVGRRVVVLPISPAAVRVAGAVGDLVGRARDRPVFFGRDKVADVLEPHQTCDPSRAFSALVWAPRHGFAEGAREAYEDYRRRGWL